MQATTKAVFKGLQDLLKYLLQFVEEELQKDSEASIFSVFLILRLAFSIHLPPSKQKTGGFFSALFGMDDGQGRVKSPQKESVEMESVVGSGSKSVEECDGGSEKEIPEKRKNDGKDQEPAEIQHRASTEETSPLKDVDSCDITSGDGDGDGSKEKSSPPPQDGGENSEQQSLEFQDPLSNMTHSHLDGSPVRTIGSASSAFTAPVGEVESTIDISRLPRAQPIATPPLSEQLHRRLANGHLSDSSHGGVRRASLNPNEQLAKGSPLRKGRAVSPSHQLLLELLASPRIYHPYETEHQSVGYVFLYKELMKSMGNAKSFLMEKKFWDVLFMSVISTDRNQLGWNEKTTELYTR